MKTNPMESDTFSAKPELHSLPQINGRSLIVRTPPPGILFQFNLPVAGQLLQTITRQPSQLPDTPPKNWSEEKWTEAKSRLQAAQTENVTEKLRRMACYLIIGEKRAGETHASPLSLSFQPESWQRDVQTLDNKELRALYDYVTADLSDWLEFIKGDQKAFVVYAAKTWRCRPSEIMFSDQASAALDIALSQWLIKEEQKKNG